jgi:sensor histidine kinase YesM
MESRPYTIADRTYRLIGIPLIAFLVPTLTEFDEFRRLTPHYGGLLFSSIVTTLLLWEGNRYLIIRLRRAFPTYPQTARRLVLEGVLALAYTFVVTNFVDWVICWGILRDERLFVGFRKSLIPTAMVLLVYETVYFFEAWKTNVRQTEALAREAVQSQLEVLKNQLDPHFLFNSLNTLAALIDDENVPAQQYLERLADVYRYVLVSRTKNTVSLEEEMAFLDAYVYLNKARFRDNLLVETELSPAAYRKYVTPLSLQMLVENAIKHNVVSKGSPLKIKIRQEGSEYLVVENNLQEKTILEKSTRVGLQNITNRYQLLTDRRVEVLRNDERFIVKLPLLSA